MKEEVGFVVASSELMGVANIVKRVCPQSFVSRRFQYRECRIEILKTPGIVTHDGKANPRLIERLSFSLQVSSLLRQCDGLGRVLKRLSRSEERRVGKR